MAAARLSPVAGFPSSWAGRATADLVRKSRWPEFTARRIALRLTQRGVATAMTREGARTSCQLVHRWESEGWQPSEGRIPALAKVMRVSEAAVLCMFSLDFGREERSGDDESDRLPVADRGGH